MKKALWIGIVFLLLTSSASLAQEPAAPPEGKARVYFFHFMGSMMGGQGAVNLFADDRFIGSVSASHYYGYDLEPGEHLLWAKYGNKKWFARAKLEAGGKYYIHVRPTTPKWNMNPVPAPVLRKACPNDKQGKKSYNWLTPRLKKNKFTEAETPSQEMLDQRTKDLADDIASILAQWESEWSKADKWVVINPEDAIP